MCFPYIVEVAFLLKSAFLYQKYLLHVVFSSFSHVDIFEIKFVANTMSGFYTEQLCYLAFLHVPIKLYLTV